TLMPERVRPAHEAGFARYRRTHEPHLIGRPVRLPARRYDGSEIDIELVLAAVPVSAGGELIVGALRDLRDRVELERQLTLTRYARAATALAARLGARLSLNDTLKSVAQALANDFAAALARVWLYDAEAETLELRASAGLSTQLETSSRAHIKVVSHPYKVGHVARTRQPFFRNDLRGDPQLEQDLVERERLASAAVYPLLAGGELKGVMAAFFRHPLPAELGDLLGMVAAIVAYSVNDAQMFEREQAARQQAEAGALRARRLEAVTTVALTHARLDDLLRAFLARLRETLDVDTADIMLLAEEEPFLTLRVGLAGNAESREKVRIPLGRGVAGLIAQSQKPLVIDDLSTVEVWTPMVRQQRSLMGAPLLVGGSAIGVVHVGTFQPRHFTDEEMKVLLLAADRMAAAIDRARLFDAQRSARLRAEQAKERASLLSEASSLLASSLDFEVTLTRLAGRAVPDLADYCMVDVLEQDGVSRTLALAHVDPARAERLREIQRRWPQSPEQKLGAPRVIQTGQSALLGEVNDQMLVQAARDAEHLAALRSLGVRSAMIVPMRARDLVLGAVSFISTRSGRSYGPDDLAMAEELARRAAVAIDNARLYREAQTAVALRDEFLSIASHELRTPLTALQLQVQSILLDASRKPRTIVSSPERLVSKLQNAERQIERLGKLIGELLDLSRIGQGRVPLSLEQVDLSRVVREAAGRMAEQAARATCPIRVRADTAVSGRWDRTRLEQVVTNLLSNAIKYGAGQTIEISVTREGELARLCVSDRGIGIAPEHLERIFGRFERAVSARHYGGLGLGL
ncbi:MAG TPA: GAF domain-containing protein, partial [Polyangia bacterium]|nr:GAF domain-containing protein [Polyangia bacterium]